MNNYSITGADSPKNKKITRAITAYHTFPNFFFF